MTARTHLFTTSDNIWMQVRHTPSSSPRPVFFMDRDGVIVEEVDYLHRLSDVRFHNGAIEAINTARAAGWLTAIVTNQAGIGYGRYGWHEFAEVNAYILDWLDKHGAGIDIVLAAPHHPSGKPPFQHPNHPMRKPNPGMLITALALLQASAQSSVMIGDKASDLEAARRAGLSQGFHVLSGHGPTERAAAEAVQNESFKVGMLSDIADPLLLQHLRALEG